MRIRFLHDHERKRFFTEAQKHHSKTWVDINGELGVPRKTMDGYKNGRLCLPEALYHELKAPNTNYNVELLEDNWGESKGGKTTYEKYPEEFARRRKNGSAAFAQRHCLYRAAVVPDIYINEPVCELLGAFIGDGCYSKTGRTRTVHFAGDSRLDARYYDETIIPILYSLDYKAHVRIKTKGNQLSVVVTNNYLSNIFEQTFGFTPGVKTYTIEIPWYVYEAGESCVRACIRGIFDTDGCVYWDKRTGYKAPYPRITLHTASKKLHDQLVSFLSQHFSLYTTKLSKRDIYAIEVYGHEQLQKWMSLIGFSNPRHLEKVVGLGGAAVAQYIGNV